MLTDDDAISQVIADEVGPFRATGGFVDRADDRGGPTKWGITMRAWTDYLRATTGYLRATANGEDIRALTEQNARDFYAWLMKSQLYRVGNTDVRYVLLDAMTLMGPHAAIECLQRALGVTVDGQLGPVTAAALPYREPRKLCSLFCIEQWRALIHIARQDLKDRNADGVPDQLANLDGGWEDRLAAKHRRYA